MMILHLSRHMYHDTYITIHLDQQPVYHHTRAAACVAYKPVCHQRATPTIQTRLSSYNPKYHDIKPISSCIMSCHVMSCHVMSCHVMRYHVITLPSSSSYTTQQNAIFISSSTLCLSLHQPHPPLTGTEADKDRTVCRQDPAWSLHRDRPPRSTCRLLCTVCVCLSLCHLPLLVCVCVCVCLCVCVCVCVYHLPPLVCVCVYMCVCVCHLPAVLCVCESVRGEAGMGRETGGKTDKMLRHMHTRRHCTRRHVASHAYTQTLHTQTLHTQTLHTHIPPARRITCSVTSMVDPSTKKTRLAKMIEF